MISVIIPVYNVVRFLSECLDSVLSQTYDDFEVILVDDGSTDGSEVICDNYAMMDKRVRVIHIPNSGVSVARNTGIKEVSGDWITFVDSDDWIGPNYLLNFRLDEGDGADLIVQGLEYYNDRSQNYSKTIRLNECTIIEPNLKKDVSDNRLLHLGFPWAKAYRTTLINQGLYFCNEISFHEDHIFVLDAFRIANKIRLVDSVEYKYRYYHSGATLSTKRHSWRNLNLASDMMINSLNKLRDMFLDSGSVYEKDIYKFAYSPKISAVFEAFCTCRTEEARQILSEIINPKELSSYYKPDSIKDKIIKSILLYAPFVVVNLFYRAYIKYVNRK